MRTRKLKAVPAPQPEPQPEKSPAQVEVDRICSRLNGYGVDVAPLLAQIVPQLKVDSLIATLLAAGLIDGPTLDADYGQRLATALRAVLQRVETQRLLAPQSALNGSPVQIGASGLILPPRNGRQ